MDPIYIKDKKESDEETPDPSSSESEVDLEEAERYGQLTLQPEELAKVQSGEWE